MPFENKVTCDACEADLTTTTNCVDYRLELSNVPIRPHDGAVTLANVYPHIEKNAAFCGLGCLSNWLKKQRAGWIATRHFKPRDGTRVLTFSAERVMRTLVFIDGEWRDEDAGVKTPEPLYWQALPKEPVT